MWYTIALFVHVLAAMGLFSAVGLILICEARIRRASTVGRLRDWAAVASGAGKSLAVVSLFILVPGLYMAQAGWSFGTPWVLAAVVTFVLLAVLGATVTGRRIEAIHRAALAAPDGPLPPPLATQLHDPVLWRSEGVRMALLVWFVFLMTIKPGLVDIILGLVVAVVLGLIVTPPIWSVWSVGRQALRR